MRPGHPPKFGDFEHLNRLTHALDPPFAVVDADALARNSTDLVRRAGGKPLRVATKSVRVRHVIERVLAHDGLTGATTYSLAESNWLADQGVGDILLAYPTTDREALRDLVADERRARTITLMVDGADTLDWIEHTLGTRRPPIRVCLEVDASMRVGSVHLGVRRSPV